MLALKLARHRGKVLQAFVLLQDDLLLRVVVPAFSRGARPPGRPCNRPKRLALPLSSTSVDVVRLLLVRVRPGGSALLLLLICGRPLAWRGRGFLLLLCCSLLALAPRLGRLRQWPLRRACPLLQRGRSSHAARLHAGQTISSVSSHLNQAEACRRIGAEGGSVMDRAACKDPAANALRARIGREGAVRVERAVPGAPPCLSPSPRGPPSPWRPSPRPPH